MGENGESRSQRPLQLSPFVVDREVDEQTISGSSLLLIHIALAQSIIIRILNLTNYKSVN